MSVGIFGKKKRNDDIHGQDICLMKGLYLKQGAAGRKQMLLNGCLRSLIVFFIVFGSVGGFLSAFGIQYNYLAVAFFYLLMSAYASMLYTFSRLVYRDIGYILFFGLFFGAIYLFSELARSGFYEIVNTVMKRAEAFFELSGIVEYDVQINNSFLTVTVFAVFVGMIEILVLNIWIYVTMGIGWTVFVSFPILLVPLYMKMPPDIFYILLLGTGYVTVMIYKANGHYMSFVGKPELRAAGLKKNKVIYNQDFSTSRTILVMSAAVCFIISMLAGNIVTPPAFEAGFKSDKLRDDTSEIISNVLLLGIGGLFNWYDSTAGMSGGRLGGISRISIDNQPDLIISFTPYSSEAVYLKGFTGGGYGDNRWLDLYQDGQMASMEQAGHTGRNEYGKGSQYEDEAGQRDRSIFEYESMKEETELLKEGYSGQSGYSSKGVMDVRNVGADPHYLYYPYYTDFLEYPMYDRNFRAKIEGITLNGEADYTYYPKLKWNGLGEQRPSDMDVSRIDEVFLDVPEKNRAVIAAECRRIGLTKDMGENDIVSAVKTYFEDNIPYTLRPGATPQGEDFINYFLITNRKGYCAHFASAATLIFRQMGIPARYVEGYVLQMETALISEQSKTKKYEDYYDGYSPVGKTAVLDVKLTDAMAHAWVEIYVEGFGWRVVEVTPGSAESVDEENFWNELSKALSDRLNVPDMDGAGMLGSIKLSGLSWMFYAIIFVIAAALLQLVLRIILRKIRRYMRCHQKDEREAVIARYSAVCDMERICSPEFSRCGSHEEQLGMFAGKYGINEDYMKVSEVMEKISFSNLKTADEDIKMAASCIQGIKTAIIRNAGILLKLKLLIR